MDLLALGALRAAEERGLSVPGAADSHRLRRHPEGRRGRAHHRQSTVSIDKGRIAGELCLVIGRATPPVTGSCRRMSRSAEPADHRRPDVESGSAGRREHRRQHKQHRHRPGAVRQDRPENAATCPALQAEQHTEQRRREDQHRLPVATVVSV